MVTKSLRARVYEVLDKNPLLTAKPLSKLLGFSTEDYQFYRGYLNKLKHDWKYYHEEQRGSIRSNPDEVHNVFYRGVIPKDVVAEVKKLLNEVWERAGQDRWIFPERPGVAGSGWKKTAARNKFLLYKSTLGRIRLFETGTVEIFVRKPANLGKCKQLFSDAFTRHYLISDLRVIDQFFGGLMRRFHATYEAGQRLPYMKITTFDETHGLTWIMGDRTHPDRVEVIVEYNAEVLQARRLFDEIKEGLHSLFNAGPPKPINRDYSV